MFWEQGLASAPYLVQRCVETWSKHNPSWRLILLDGRSAHALLACDPSMAHLGMAHRSDLLRLELLARHGGVWADPTCLCRRPLDDWIDSACSSGFFAFERPGRDRLIANWFLAAQPRSLLVLRLQQRLHSYWQQQCFDPLTMKQRRVVKVLSAVLNRSHLTTRFWFSPVVSRWLHVYPYFVFHYAFERLIATDAECQQIWRLTTRLSARPPRVVERLGFHTLATPALLTKIEQSPAPLFKLSWQYACEAGFEHTLLHQVLAHAS